MKRPIAFAYVVLIASMVAMVGCPSGKTKTNSLQVVETAYMVVHPSANKGDTIVFQIPSDAGGTTYVHFPLQSPCAEHDLTGTPGHPPQCKVTADVRETSLAQYPYTIDSNPGPVKELPQGRCQSCCRMCDIIIPNPNPDEQPLIPSGFAGSGQYPTVEILIDETGSGTLVAQNTPAYPGQQVKWFRSGTGDIAWSVSFEDPTACTAKKPIGSGIVQTPVCTVAGTVAGSPYKYTMTGGGMTGTGYLYVSPPVPTK